jgi:hypothetical protein
VERALSAWVESLVPGSVARLLGLDGKTLCGSQQGAEAPGVHLLSVFLRQPGCTLAQLRVDQKTNEPKAALELLAGLILEGAVVSGDAIFCQKELCAEVVQQKGDYLFVVKDNQATLRAAIDEAFDTPVSPLRRAALAG